MVFRCLDVYWLCVVKVVAVVAVFLRRWLEAIRPSVRLSTRTRYAQGVERYLVPALGRSRLAALRQS